MNIDITSFRNEFSKNMSKSWITIKCVLSLKTKNMKMN